MSATFWIRRRKLAAKAKKTKDNLATTAKAENATKPAKSANKKDGGKDGR